MLQIRLDVGKGGGGFFLNIFRNFIVNFVGLSNLKFTLDAHKLEPSVNRTEC